MNDIFEKIITREIPASIVYEDDTVLAFLDIKPINKGHTLVIPKVHARNVFDIESETFGHMMKVAKNIAAAIKEACGADGVNISMNNEAAAGQDVFHAHVHVIPRFTGDEVFPHAKHTTYDEGEAETVRELLKNALR